MDLEFGATVIPEFTGTIVDVDGEYWLIAKKNKQNKVALLSTSRTHLHAMVASKIVVQLS